MLLYDLSFGRIFVNVLWTRWNFLFWSGKLLSVTRITQLFGETFVIFFFNYWNQWRIDSESILKPISSRLCISAQFLKKSEQIFEFFLAMVLAFSRHNIICFRNCILHPSRPTFEHKTSSVEEKLSNLETSNFYINPRSWDHNDDNNTSDIGR